MATVHEHLGYRIVLNRTPIQRISIESVINAGFLYETRETTGVNHLLEHVLTEAWTKCGASCSEFWSNRGVRMNASTDETIMMYYVKGLTEDVKAMVEYIVAITTHPILKKQTVTHEKQAVIDELMTYGSDPVSKLDAALNHLFYKNGLEFKDDWKLQIKNLRHLDLAAIQAVYRKEFTPANVVFVVSGNFDPKTILSYFHKLLPPSPAGRREVADGFTWAHEIRYIPDSMATSLVVVWMPSATVAADVVLAPLATAILSDILFGELRTKRQLVYGASVNASLTTCGTRLQIKIYVQPVNLIECLRIVVAQVNRCTVTVPPEKLLAAKKQARQDFATSVPDAEFYAAQYITSPDFILSLAAQQKAYQAATSTAVAATLRALVDWNHAVCVYQGHKNVALTWQKMGL